MSARAFLVSAALVLGILAAPSMSTAETPRSVVRLSTSTATVTVGKHAHFVVRVPRREWGQVEIQERTSRGWREAASSVHNRSGVVRLSAQVRTYGAHRYRAVVTPPLGRPRPAPSRSIVVHGRISSTPEVETQWDPDPDHLSVWVRLNSWIRPRPSVALEERVGGSWVRRDAAEGRAVDGWLVPLAAEVSGDLPLRVIGNGPGWSIRQQIVPLMRGVRTLVIDGPELTIGSGNSYAPHRFTFAGSAGDDVVLAMEPSIYPYIELTGPDGERLTWPVAEGALHWVTLPRSGIYTVRLWHGEPVMSVRLIRPSTVEVLIDGDDVTAAAVSDRYLPRAVVFHGEPGTTFIGKVKLDDSPAGSEGCHWRQLASPSATEWLPSWDLNAVIGADGSYHVQLVCATPGAVTVSADRTTP